MQSFCSGPRVFKCTMCKEMIPIGQGTECEGYKVHKDCFKCGLCEVPLKQGSCAFDHVLYRHFGPMWFCSIHMMMGSGEKYEALVKKYGPPRGFRV